jgi:hypothetical protein
MADANEAARKAELHQKYMDELERKRLKNEAEARLERSWNNKIRAKMGLPPIPEPGTPGAPGSAPSPSGAAPSPGGAATAAPTAGGPPTTRTAPVTPPAVNPRPPVTAPSVSAVGQMPPGQTVRTLDGDFRRQNINGQDQAVPLVELTDSGAFVPNANALGIDDWKSAYTQRDSLAVADMIRQSQDPQAKREQQRIDAARRSIMASAKLTPDQRKAALDQLNSQQADLHYGFMQSQGVGSGVRAGFGDMSPTAPMNEQVFAIMDQLRKQYPNATESELFLAAQAMASESAQRTQMNGQVPSSVWRRKDLAANEREIEQWDKDKQESDRTMQLALDLQSKGMDHNDAVVAAHAIAQGDQKTAMMMFEKSKDRKALEAAKQRRAPVSDTEINKQIDSQVLGADAAYQAKLQRYMLLTRAQANDAKALEELGKAGIFPNTPQWDKIFKPSTDQKGNPVPSEYQQLDETLRKAVSTARYTGDNRKKAEAQIREARGEKPFFDMESPEAQMAMIDIMRLRMIGRDDEALHALETYFSNYEKLPFKFLLMARPGGDAFKRFANQPGLPPGLLERMRRWGIPTQ